jgi:hypothetical protein
VADELGAACDAVVSEAAVDGATLAGVWTDGAVLAAGAHAANIIAAAAVSANPRFLSMHSSCFALRPTGARSSPTRRSSKAEGYDAELGAVTPAPAEPYVSARSAAAHGMTSRSTTTTIR